MKITVSDDELVAALVAGMVAGHVVGWKPWRGVGAEEALARAVEADVIELARRFVREVRQIVAGRLS